MKHLKKILAFCLVIAMTLGIMGCSTTPNKSGETTEAEKIKIGIISYNVSSNEAVMFKSYLKDYLGDIFNVEFCFSDSVRSLEDEKAFVDQAKQQGCKGIISFMSYNLVEIVDYCGEDMFFAVQNMTPTDEEFKALEDKPQFLGVVSPSNEAEYKAGVKIATALVDESNNTAKTWLVFSGGASYGNNMHIQRFKGITDVLTKAGYKFSCTEEELLKLEAPKMVATSADGGQVYVCPGYPSIYKENVEKALGMCEADYIVSCGSFEDSIELINNYRKNLSKELEVSLVDCFSEAVSKEVNSDNINHIAGKYAALEVPSFIAMMNAAHGCVEVVKKDGKAYWINQDMWSADTKEEFQKKYSDSVNIYTNMYSPADLIDLVGSYNKDASYEKFIDKMTK